MTATGLEHHPEGPPLAVITRALEDASDFVLPVQANGWHVAGIPMITCNAVAFKPTNQTVDWLAFTSRWGIKHYLGQGGIVPQGSKIVVVGLRTAQLLEKHGLTSAFIAEDRTSHSLALTLLAASPTPQRVLWPCGNRALQDWIQPLAEKGWDIGSLQVYRTHLETQLTEEHSAACQKATVIAFTSPSCVEALFQGLRNDDVILNPQIKLLAIGPTTQSALKQWFGRCDGVAVSHSLAGLAELIIQGPLSVTDLSQ